MIPLLSLRLDAIEADGLRWYFCEAEGDLGLKSGLGLQLERARVAGGRNKGSKPLGNARAKDLSDEQMEAAWQLSRIRRRLDRLSPWARTVLRVHYGPLLPAHRQHEPSHTGGEGEPGARSEDRPLAIFGDHLGLVLYLTACDDIAIERVIETARRAKESKGQRRESAQARVDGWIREADQALVGATFLYSTTRPGRAG